MDDFGENVKGVLKRGDSGLAANLTSKAKGIFTNAPFTRDNITDFAKITDNANEINNLVTNNTVLETAKNSDKLKDTWDGLMTTNVGDLGKKDGTFITRLFRVGERNVYKDFHDWFKEVANKAGIKDLSSEKDNTVRSVLEKVLLEKTADGSVTIPAFKK